MTDRELLERAAEAIGMYVLHERAEWPRENVGWFFNQVGGHPPALYDRANNLKGWFPLTDDGDALRLAVKRGVFWRPEFAHFLSLERFSAQDKDDCHAYRRAIVRTAALADSEGGTP